MPNKRKSKRVQEAWTTSISHLYKPDTTKASNYVYTEEFKIPSKKPTNFSWIIDGLLAGSSYPSKQEHFQFYLEQGIKHVVTLTKWKPPIPPGIKQIFIPIGEFEAPSVKQIEVFINAVEKAEAKKEAVVVHCHWGRGRTGTMLAAYLVKHNSMTPRDAICEVRTRRPSSIETDEQENVIYEYLRFLKTCAKKDDNNIKTSNQHHLVTSSQTEDNDSIQDDGAACSYLSYFTRVHNGDQFS